MSVFSGMSRPMKAAGVVLVGVAIVAAVIGGITALSGGNGSNEAGPKKRVGFAWSNVLFRKSWSPVMLLKRDML